MNMFKFLSFILLSVCLLFGGCKKENPSVNSDSSIVEITVCNSKGELLENQVVKMYDEATYEIFKENHTTKALWELTTDKNGKVNFILENKKWFSGISSRELMFVVLDAVNAGNYKWWSRGGTITAGKKHTFRIEIDRKIAESPEHSTEESKLVIENGVLVGLKDHSLTRVVLPANVKSIAPGAFWKSKIESLVLNEGLEFIGVQAFAKSQNLASVTFPASLKKIGEHAFEDCTALAEINLSKANLEEIGSSAFRDTGLKKVTFSSSLKKIASQAFLGTQLVNVEFPEGLQEIEGEAFRDIATLKSISLPNGIQKIGDMAFYACAQLEEVKSIGRMISAGGIVEDAAFDGCQALKRIVLPQSITELQKGIFIECTNLQEIVLPKSVKKIGEYGLRTNHKIKKIRFESNEAPDLENSSLPFLEDITEILVPRGKSDIYKAKYTDYKSIIRENP